MKLVKVVHDNQTTYIVSESPNLGTIANTYPNTKSVEILDGNVVSEVHHGDENQKTLAVACGALKMSISQVASSSRVGSVVSLKRSVVMYYMRMNYNLSYTEIGKMVNRDHTTVISANRKINNILKNTLSTDYDTVLSYLSEINKTINRNN